MYSMVKFIVDDIVAFQNKNNSLKMRIIKIVQKDINFPLANKHNPIISVKIYFKIVKQYAIARFYSSDLVLLERL